MEEKVAQALEGVEDKIKTRVDELALQVINDYAAMKGSKFDITTDYMLDLVVPRLHELLKVHGLTAVVTSRDRREFAITKLMSQGRGDQHDEF